jgi:adenylylsulfate kinase
MINTTGFTLWFTGMSGSGKSTLANYIGARLRLIGRNVEILDGDEVREHLSKGLGFSREDRDTNVRRIGYVAKLLTRNNTIAITAAISPYRDTRDEQRKQIGRFVEIFVDCPVETLIERDTKGLYKKALAGELRNFTGITDPYEPPTHAETIVNSGAETVEESAGRIFQSLLDVAYLKSEEVKNMTGKRLRPTPPPKGKSKGGAARRPAKAKTATAKARPAQRHAKTAKKQAKKAR